MIASFGCGAFGFAALVGRRKNYIAVPKDKRPMDLTTVRCSNVVIGHRIKSEIMDKKKFTFRMQCNSTLDKKHWKAYGKTKPLICVMDYPA